MRGFFVTGTDTGVGKTVVTAALAAVLRGRGLDVGVAKPVATGAVRREGVLVPTDAEFLKRISGVEDTLDEICPLVFETPAAPVTAAECEHRIVDLDIVRKALRDLADRHTWLLVEGIGGWRVPLTETVTVRELAQELRLPVLVTARAGLGTINHTTLTVEAVRSAGLDVAGVVLVETEPSPRDVTVRSNPRQIERLTGVRVLGILPHDPTLAVEDGQPGRIVRSIEDHLDLEYLVDLMKQQTG